jgi:hypothetical protein
MRLPMAAVALFVMLGFNLLQSLSTAMGRLESMIVDMG